MQGHTVASTASGEILAFTGTRVWRYDPGEGWVACAANSHLGEPVFAYATPVPLADGRIAVLVPGAGRRDIDTDEVDLCADDAPVFTLLDAYDPAADAWSTVGAFEGLSRESNAISQGRVSASRSANMM
jgi:hypothetical protein